MENKSMRSTFRLTLGEEIGNSITHGVMAILCLCTLPVFAIYAYQIGGILRAFGVSVFIICLFLMFLISTIYHTMQYNSEHKYIFRKLDHICILLAIAGSYTPVALSIMQGWQAAIILFIEWSMVIAGILLKSIARKHYPKLSMTIYMVMGWTALIFLPTLLKTASPAFLLFIVLGGIMYTVGAFFYAHPEKKYFHMIWHLFINLASICHIYAIVFLM